MASDPLDTIKQGEHCVEDMGDIEVLIGMVELWRATWALWRPGIENTRDFHEKDGNEPRAKAYAAILRDFDACLDREQP